MNKQTVIVASLLFCAIFFMIISGCVTESPPRMCVSNADFYIQIQTDHPISNVTLLLPLPVKDGVPTIGALRINESMFNNENYSIEFFQQPLANDQNTTDSIINAHPWYLKIYTDRIDPGMLRNPVLDFDISSRSRSVNPAVFSNTLHPVGNESVLLPKNDLSLPIRILVPSRSAEWIEYAPFQTKQTLSVYAYYSAEPTTRVEILSGIHESNSWVEPAAPGSQYSGIDGGGNSYSDYYSWTWFGDSRGWHDVVGEFSSQQCVYPNPDHPRWQNLKY
jgi:hypothetical protein